MGSPLPEPEDSLFPLHGTNHVHEPQLHQCAVKQPLNAATVPSLVADYGDMETQKGLLQLWEGKKKNQEGREVQDRPLQLLDLSIDILREIVKEVS